MKKTALVGDRKDILRLLRRFKGLYSTVRTNLSSPKGLLQNIVQFIFKNINLLIKENPA